METQPIASITIAMFEDKEKMIKVLNDNFSLLDMQNKYLISKMDAFEWDIKDIKKDLKTINEKLDILLSR